MTLIVDCVFAELDAPDAATASARVAGALAAIGQPPPHGCEQGVPMPDPVPGRWGVELTFPDGTGVTTVAEAWVVAHALASELGPDARVQPCFAGTVARPGVESWVDADDAPQDVAWHLAAMRVDGAHAMARTANREPGHGVVIGHPDTGFTRHPDIWAEGAGPVVSGQNFLEDGDSADPQLAGPLRQPGHGTMTASVMVAQSGRLVSRADEVSRVDLRGVAPGARVMAYRVTDSVVVLGWGRRLARAIERAVDDDCHVLSLSLGGIGDSRLDRAIRYAEARGVVVVAAAGNVWPWVVAPANHPLVVACAAADAAERPWRRSASGPSVDVTAPGHGVWVAAWRGHVPVAEASSGTSYATAAVAGACALWRSHHADALARIHRSRHPAMFREALRASARPAALGEGFGAGMLDCQALLAQAPGRSVTEPFRDEPVRDEPVRDELAAVLGPAGVTAHALLLEGIDTAERAELAFHLASDPVARAAWRDSTVAPPPVPPLATRRLQIALHGQRRQGHAAASVVAASEPPVPAPVIAQVPAAHTSTERIKIDLEVGVRVAPKRAEP